MIHLKYGKILLTSLVLMMAIPYKARSVSGKPASSDVVVGEKHVYLLQPGVDTIWGTYLFLIVNQGSEPVTTVVDLTLPEETIDFRPHAGLSQDELELGENGGVTLKKEFQPGDNLISLGFKVQAPGGQGSLTFQPKQPIPQLAVFALKDAVKMQGEKFEFKTDVPFGEAEYDTMTRKNVLGNQRAAITVYGIPQGRSSFTLVGMTTLFVLMGCGGFLTWKTRPSHKNIEDVEI